MSLFRNRIGISLLVILAATYLWEFWIRPVSGPVYTAAVSQYKNGNYRKSLDLVDQAYLIDPNDTAILTLMGWNKLKLNRPMEAEPNFARAHRLAPDSTDAILGFAYTEIALKHYEKAASLLEILRQKGTNTADVHLAWGALYRESGRNMEAAREFKQALALRKNDPLALKNLQQLYNTKNATQAANIEFTPLVRPTKLTYTTRAEGDHFARLVNGSWKPVYLTGIDLNAALPGDFPYDSVSNPDVYAGWLREISNLGVNTIRLMTILPPAFYRALYEFDKDGSHPPLWLLQGFPFPDPPSDNNLLGASYSNTCNAEITAAVDVVHGQGNVGSSPLHSGGLYPNDVSPWVVGFVVGNTWLSHVVTANDQAHPDLHSYQGSFLQVSSGTPTEIFLAQMVERLEQYEEEKYNWQHPVAFLNWPTLDPMHHPTESTMTEEMAIRRSLGERFMTPPGPYDNDDSATVNPMDLHATLKLAAGYFADYNVSPFYPDFLNLDPGYQAVQDSQGSDPFLGYLLDLKAHHRGIPLVISDYGIPSSLGIGHFSPAGFNEGGKTPEEEGNLLARFTRNVYDSGAAGGTVFEWLDEWFRRSWITRNYETPEQDKPLWTNFLDPTEYYGLIAADPDRRAAHQLEGNPAAWINIPPFYKESKPGLFSSLGDRWDSARDLKSLYVDADEGFLYLRLVVSKLDPDNKGQPDWSEVNYLIGIGTDPGHAGLTYLPYIAPVRFGGGMTYAIQLAGPESSHIWIASSYDPYHVVAVEGIPSETLLAQKLGWKPQITDVGTFESQIIEPNRRRFSPAGKYFPVIRYDRGILRYGTLDPNSKDYDALAEWHANTATNTIDVRIPWALLNVTDPSKNLIFAGLQKDGTVDTTTTPGFDIVVFSYHPLKSAQLRPIMEQGHPIADSLPALSGPATMPKGEIRRFLWAKWDQPQYSLRAKPTYNILRRAFLALPTAPPPQNRARTTAGPKAPRRGGKSPSVTRPR
jgi:Flp pilus assembly protein TadD